MVNYGVHISTAGNLYGTPERAAQMGARSIQIFAGNPRGWSQPTYTASDGEKFKDAVTASKLTSTWIHMLYLTSYGTPDDALRQRTVTAMTHTLTSASILGVTGVVTHMGSTKGEGFDQALGRITDSYSRCLEVDGASLMCLENSAGAGSNIGASLEELAHMLDAMKGHARLRICIDTAHALAAGYELRTEVGLDDFVTQFERLIGLDRLAVIHLNDSKSDLNSRVDRHENIGDGYIGNEGFRHLLNHPKLQRVPGILEVPGIDGHGPDVANLERLAALTV